MSSFVVENLSIAIGLNAQRVKGTPNKREYGDLVLTYIDGAPDEDVLDVLKARAYAEGRYVVGHPKVDVIHFAPEPRTADPYGRHGSIWWKARGAKPGWKRRSRVVHNLQW